MLQRSDPLREIKGAYKSTVWSVEITERDLVTVLVLPMSWSSKIPGVNILENHHCCNPITWLRRIAFIFIFIFDIFVIFLLFFVHCYVTRVSIISDITKCGVQLQIEVIRRNYS